MQKYQEYFQKMINDNKELFESFKKLHDKYALSQDGLQQEFNGLGEKVMEMVREYENRLCSNQERGIYNKYSTNLAEKFQAEVRKHFPMIDHVGLIVEEFSIKKISL